MDYLFYQVAAINGFDSFGHYLRAGLIVNQCSVVRHEADAGLLGEVRRRDRDRRLRLAPGRATASCAPPPRRSAARSPASRRPGSGASSASASPRSGSPARRPRRPTRSRASRPRRPRRRRPRRRPRPTATPAPRRRDADPGAARQPTSSCSTTSSGRTPDEVALGRRDRRQPRPDRRRDDPRGAGRRLPRLQRQPGPAVRADLQPQGRGPERGRPGARQRRAHRRHAGRRGGRHHRRAARRRLQHRGAVAQARARRDAAAARTRRCSSARSRRSASSTSSSRAAAPRRASPTATRSRSRRPRPRPSSSTSSRTCSTTRRARRCARTSTGSATRSPAAASSINEAIAAFRPLLRDVIPVAQNLSTRTRTSSASCTTLGDAAAIVAPAAEDAGASCSSTSTRRWRRCARSRGPTSRTRSRAGAQRSTRRSGRFPPQRPFLLNSEGLFRELRPGVRALRTSAPILADASRGRHAGAAPLRRAQPPARAAAARAADVLRGPARAARHRRPDRRRAHAEPDAAVPRARPDCSATT